MRYIVLVATLLLASSVSANEDNSLIDVKFLDTAAGEVAEFVNTKCVGITEPIVLKNPEKKLSLNLENMHCASVGTLLREFDSRET